VVAAAGPPGAEGSSQASWHGPGNLRPDSRMLYHWQTGPTQAVKGCDAMLPYGCGQSREVYVPDAGRCYLARLDCAFTARRTMRLSG
jgi:hypothetical protein